jgi:hypothetical protein
VDNHVHLGDTSQLFIDLDAEEVLLRKVVPIGEVTTALAGIGAVFRKTAVRLAADVVKGIEEEAARTTCGVEHEMFSFRVEHFDGEGNEFARGEILAEVALEETAHERLEGDALGVEFGAVKGDAFQMLDALRKDGRLDVDLVSEDIRLQFLLSDVELVDTGGEFVGGLLATALEVVGFAVLTVVVLFVAVFDEDNFAEFAEGGDGAAAATFPKGLVALTDGGAGFLTRDRGEVFAAGSFSFRIGVA